VNPRHAWHAYRSCVTRYALMPWMPDGTGPDHSRLTPGATALPHEKVRMPTYGEAAMRRRPRRMYPRGLHLALRTQTGYRPAMVVQDGGGDSVKVRYTANGLIQERWVERAQLVPPPWVGSLASVGD
jgi:hypothetical protein